MRRRRPSERQEGISLRKWLFLVNFGLAGPTMLMSPSTPVICGAKRLLRIFYFSPFVHGLHPHVIYICKCVYYFTPLPLNLASNKQQQARLLSVLAITPSQRFWLCSTLTICIDTCPSQIQSLVPKCSNIQVKKGSKTCFSKIGLGPLWIVFLAHV